MNNRQRAKLDSYNRISDFNNKYQSVLSSITEYAAEKTKFDSMLSAINASGGLQQLVPGSDAAAADAAKIAMAKTLVKFSLRAAVKAKSNGDITLGKELEFSSSEIYKLPKTQAMQVCTNLRNLINDNLATLTNVSAADVTDMDNAIDAYNAVKDAAVETKQAKKSSGTDQLPALMADADEAVSNMADLVTSYLDEQNHAVVMEFMLAKQIISTGIRGTSVSFSILADENGQTIPGGQVTDDQTGKVYPADDTGVVHIKNHRAGHFHFIVSASGRIDLDFVCDVKQGMSNDFTVRLKKA